MTQNLLKITAQSPLELTTRSELTSLYPLTEELQSHITDSRTQIEKIISGEDSRLLLIVGPCSLHDHEAALDYAQRLAPLHAKYKDELLIVMRAYLEKPRSTTGWKGLVSDPLLDGSCQRVLGLKQGRKLMTHIAHLKLPLATEFLDPITAHYFLDLISWGAIGARTCESQIHRQFASGLPCPVGFKNRTDGNVDIAIHAIETARASHQVYFPDDQGKIQLLHTQGHEHTHIILRGGDQPNCDAKSLHESVRCLQKKGLHSRVMIDCSHGNSGKDHVRQIQVIEDMIEMLEQGEQHMMGLMIESFIEGGKQPLQHDTPLKYGQSITDACIDWETTERLLEKLAQATRTRVLKKTAP